MSVISMKQLLEAGVHFGHQTRRWNPKMAPYIYTERNGIYIIDLQKSVGKVDEAYDAISDIAAQGGTILFVGTKKQAQDAIKTEAERCGMYYVNERWLGGMLTNFRTIQSRIARLKEIETMSEDGTFDVLPKKEVIALKKEWDKLEKNLGGIKDMKRIPDAIFIVDLSPQATDEGRVCHIIPLTGHIRTPAPHPALRTTFPRGGRLIMEGVITMDKQNRKAIIAGNWKMNKTATEAKALISELIPAVKDAGCEVVICVPFTDLVTAVEMTKGTNIHVGAENVHFEKSGAFTGEISADMLTDLGVEYVVIGHSERRQYFAETNETVNKRTKAALAGGLKPIICVGESLDQREQGVTEELVRMQVKIALNGVTADELKNVVIAYEPIWAIGTGKTATADQAEEVCAAIRKVVGELYGEDAAKALTVQYGGSMNPKNAEELLSKPDVDGGLIGGASLKADQFAVIVDAATKG